MSGPDKPATPGSGRPPPPRASVVRFKAQPAENSAYPKSFAQMLVEAAGGVFLGEPGTVTTPEAIAEGDPEVVIAAWCGAGDRVPLSKLAARPGWEAVRAVREGRVYCIADELLNGASFAGDFIMRCPGRFLGFARLRDYYTALPPAR